MLKRALILLFLALAQFGCGYEYGDQYEPASIGDPQRLGFEVEKRDLLRIEELKIGKGSLAAWGRRLSADIEVRYVDGTLVFNGSIFDLVGFEHMPETGLYDARHLNGGQPGIRLGLNGMAVGGKRRIIVDHKMVCTNLSENALPEATCHLVGPGNSGRTYMVRKENLLVEATLTESCVPVRVVAFLIRWGINWELYCRTLDELKPDPTLPVWHFY